MTPLCYRDPPHLVLLAKSEGKVKINHYLYHSFLASQEACWASPWFPAPPPATVSRVPAPHLALVLLKMTRSHAQVSQR